MCSCAASTWHRGLSSAAQYLRYEEHVVRLTQHGVCFWLGIVVQHRRVASASHGPIRQACRVWRRRRVPLVAGLAVSWHFPGFPAEAISCGRQVCLLVFLKAHKLWRSRLGEKRGQRFFNVFCEHINFAEGST